MAGIAWTAQTAPVAVTATPATVLQIVAASNVREKLKRLRIGFNGQSGANEPVLCELLMQSDAGTSSALTPIKTGAGGETLQVTARHTATVEPTGSTVVWRQYVHPQTNYETDLTDFQLPGGSRVGLRVTAPNNVSMVAGIDGEE